MAFTAKDREEIIRSLHCTEEQLNEIELKLQRDHERFLRDNEERAKAMKFRKEKNKERWNANNGTMIQYNHTFNTYDINRGTFFAFADTLAEAMRIAKHDTRFNIQRK